MLERRVLEDKPISVIKDFLTEDLSRLCIEAERIGAGTEKMRRKVWDNLEKLENVFLATERDMLKLSTNSRYVVVPKEAGHMVVMHAPDSVLDEMMWVYEEARKRALLS